MFKKKLKNKTPVNVICLDKDSFKRLLGPLEEILNKNSETYEKYSKLQ